MTIKARKLKDAETPERTELYVVTKSRNIIVEEKQQDGSLDQVSLEYCIEDDDVGYFAKEYRPGDVQKDGAKVIDITAVMVKRVEKYVRWHLYDMKDTLAGEYTAVHLYDQWNAGFRYLQKNVLDRMPECLAVPDLGVITRCYDEDRMIRLRNEYQRRCDEIKEPKQTLTLPQRKKRTEIARYRGILTASQAILDKVFEPEGGGEIYEIHIRQLIPENGQIYKIKFPV